MNVDFINTLLKIFMIHILTFIINIKIIPKARNKKDYMIVIISSIGITLLYVVIIKYLDNLLSIIIVYIIQLMILKRFINEKEN